MAISDAAKRRLAAARDIGAVLAFLGLAAAGWRALADSPYLQKERLTAKEAREDLSEFFERVEKVHPDPRAFAGAEGYAALKAGAFAGVEARLDELGRVQMKDFADVLFKASAALGDGHTGARWVPPRKWRDPERKFPPFTLRYRFGEFAVDRAEDPALEGAALLEIDGKPFRDFLAPALARIAGETSQFRAARFCSGQDFWWDFTGLLTGRETFSVKVRGPEGKVFRKKLGTVSARQFARLPPPIREPWRVIYDNRKLAWVNFDSMVYSRAQRKAYDGLFRELSEAGVRTLVLDVSRNGGGDSRIGSYVLSYLLDRPAPEVPRRPGERFKGRTCLIIGPRTYSSAMIFASAFRASGAGEILGEESGGAEQHYGDPKSFKLSNSGIRYSVSTAHYKSARPEPGDDRRGLSPDLPVTEAMLRPYGGSLRSFVLDYAAANGGEKR